MREEVPDNTHFIHIPPQRTTNIADFNKIAENPGMYLNRDGYHLNDDAGKYIATEIKKTANKPIKSNYEGKPTCQNNHPGDLIHNDCEDPESNDETHSRN